MHLKSVRKSDKSILNVFQGKRRGGGSFLSLFLLSRNLISIPHYISMMIYFLKNLLKIRYFHLISYMKVWKINMFIIISVLGVIVTNFTCITRRNKPLYCQLNDSVFLLIFNNEDKLYMSFGFPKCKQTKNDEFKSENKRIYKYINS